MTDKQPTIEELQAEIIKLKQEAESNNAKISSLENSNANLTKDLNASREVNGKLWASVGSYKEIPESEVQAENEPTPEEILDTILTDAIKPNLKQMKKMYGEYVNTELIDNQTNN
ncbi:hypothetical protein [Candidatus Methanoprimaticola sp. MG2]|uniref:hypothetical protein n=1 Tax=Candidatus Methanoprimaticola sp. MG2 TaxID=3228838 RepID=UPI0039C63D36